MNSVLLVLLLVQGAVDAGDPCDSTNPEKSKLWQCQCVNGTTMNCGTNIGACTMGVQTCMRGRWSPCKDGTFPQAEVLFDGTDNNCNGVIDEHDPVPLYAYLIAGILGGFVIHAWQKRRKKRSLV